MTDRNNNSKPMAILSPRSELASRKSIPTFQQYIEMNNA